MKKPCLGSENCQRGDGNLAEGPLLLIRVWGFDLTGGRRHSLTPDKKLLGSLCRNECEERPQFPPLRSETKKGSTSILAFFLTTAETNPAVLTNHLLNEENQLPTENVSSEGSCVS